MANKKILVVEDEHITAEYLGYRLKHLGYEVLPILKRGEDVIEQVGDLQPDLILMDIMLEGDMDGIEAAERVLQTHDIPVIYLTALSDPRTFERAKVTGSFAYLVKPFDDTQLHRTIEMTLYKNMLEQQIKESQKWFSTTLRSIGDGVIASDDTGRVKFINPAAVTILETAAEELTGQSWYTFCHLIDADTGERLSDPVEQVLSSKQQVDLDDRAALVLADERQKFVEVNASPIMVKPGIVNGVVMVIRDISRKKAVEEDLRIKDMAIASSINAMVIMDLSGNLTYANRSFRDLWGYDHPEDWMGVPSTHFWKMEEKADEIVESLLEDESWSGKLTAIRRDGSTFEVQYSMTMVVDDTNRPICLLASFVELSA